MKNEDFKNEFLDLQVYKNLGIKNYTQRLASYPKGLNNKHHLAYDSYSIYQLDKLQMTFQSDYSNPNFSNILCINNDGNKYYKLDEYIYLESDSRKRIDYECNFSIIVSGMSFGHIYFKHVRNMPRVQIDMKNQFLYSQTNYEIIDNLGKISKNLDLTFNNILRFELARDSTVDIYDKYTMVYYQSDFCAEQVHKAHNSKPKFSKYSKIKHISIVTDQRNRNLGTAYIGKSTSALQLKIYSKSSELLKWKNRKSYISEIHRKHFGFTNGITRTEAMATSETVNKYDWDILDLLITENHPKIFYTLVGDKLTFKNLESRTWDKNNNAKYELIRLLPDNADSLATKSVKISNRPFKSHNTNINKLEIMVHSFLDEEINVMAIYGFLNSNYLKYGVPNETILIDIENSLKSYKNPINKAFERKKRLINSIAESNGAISKIIPAFWNYFVEPYCPYCIIKKIN